MLKIKIAFDGACNNHLIKRNINPPLGLGIATFINNVYCDELSKFVGINAAPGNTSNVAEWMACVEAMKLAAELKRGMCQTDTLDIQSDSQLITEQYNEVFNINQENLKKYFRQAKEIANKSGIGALKINWVPREQNKEADRLSKLGIKSQSISVNDSNPISGNN